VSTNRGDNLAASFYFDLSYKYISSISLVYQVLIYLLESNQSQVLHYKLIKARLLMYYHTIIDWFESKVFIKLAP
jgi:hypothetical protein